MYPIKEIANLQKNKKLHIIYANHNCLQANRFARLRVQVMIIYLSKKHLFTFVHYLICCVQCLLLF